MSGFLSGLFFISSKISAILSIFLSSLQQYQFYFVLARRLKKFDCQFLFAFQFEQQFEELAQHITFLYPKF